MREQRTNARKQRGMTLIEVLIALFILFVVMVAVLELVSLSYTVSLGSKARTDMMFRAERVVETLRWQLALSRAGNPTSAACCPLSGAPYTIPSSGTCYDSFWGPTGPASVIGPNPPCTLTYSFTGSQVTVVASPLTTGSYQYMGPVAQKVVRYVAQL
jgi:prepilin-type N-terminal cleavage/methylation domain-containing protein